MRGRSTPYNCNRFTTRPGGISTIRPKSVLIRSPANYGTGVVTQFLYIIDVITLE